MDFNPLAFMELIIVLAFAAGWVVLECVSRTYDKKPDDGGELDSKRDRQRR